MSMYVVEQHHFFLLQLFTTLSYVTACGICEHL